MALKHGTIHNGPGANDTFWGFRGYNHSAHTIWPGRAVCWNVIGAGSGFQVSMIGLATGQTSKSRVIGVAQQTMLNWNAATTTSQYGYVAAVGPADLFVTGVVTMGDLFKVTLIPAGAAIAGADGTNRIFAAPLETKAASTAALVKCFIFPQRF